MQCAVLSQILELFCFHKDGKSVSYFFHLKDFAQIIIIFFEIVSVINLLNPYSARIYMAPIPKRIIKF